MADAAAPLPSPFVVRWLSSHPPRMGARALDLGCGRGRHALAMARAGYRVTAIDVQFDALASLWAWARQEMLAVAPVCADLTRLPLPTHRFDLIVVTRYLDRTWFPALREALAPCGVLLYETFTEHQLRYGRGPRSPEHLLKPGELRTLVRNLDILFDEEVMQPEAVARVAAQRTGTDGGQELDADRRFRSC